MSKVWPDSQGCYITIKLKENRLIINTLNQQDLQLVDLRQQVHPGCIVCSPDNLSGLKMDYRVTGEKEVSAQFQFDRNYQGYGNRLHGGVISAILDGAMANCLFAQNCVAVTADLHIRFRHPILTGHYGQVRAWIVRETPPIYVVEAEIIQDDQLRVVATGKFMKLNHPIEGTTTDE